MLICNLRKQQQTKPHSFYMKKIALSVIGIMMLSNSLWAQKTWTLEDCINYAMENNLTIRSAHLSTQSAEEDVKGSKGALLPTLSASSTHSVGYSPWTKSTDGAKVSKSYYNGSYGINAHWTLWNGNRNHNMVKLNKLNAEQAALDAQTIANSIQEIIAQLYVQILYLNEAVKVCEQSLETSKKNEQRGLQMLELGKMSKADVAQLSAQRATDEYTIVEAKANIAKCKLQLKQTLELNNEISFEIEIPTISDDQALTEIPNVMNVYEQAMLIRPEIKSSDLAVESSELSTKIARAGYMPTLSLTGSLGTNTNSRSSDKFGSQLKTNFDMGAGLSVSIPIFDGRDTKTAIRKARIQQEKAIMSRMEIEDDLYRTIEEYWLDAETNQQKFRAAQATVASEQQSYDLLQEQFQLGLKNIVELMTGKDKLLSSQQNMLQSKYQTILAQQMLKFYSTSRISK